jgi:hypothetical protein
MRGGKNPLVSDFTSRSAEGSISVEATPIPAETKRTEGTIGAAMFMILDVVGDPVKHGVALEVITTFIANDCPNVRVVVV